MTSQLNATDLHDITILGGGPTGLFAAFYAGLRNASCKIIDSMPALGGRLTAVYPEKYIYDVAGFPKILAKDLVDNLVAQAQAYSPTLCLDEAAQTLTRVTLDSGESVFALGTDKGTHLTRTLVIAAGVGQYTPKKHTAPGADVFENRGVAYAVIEKNIYAGRRVVVFGGGDSALDWANELVPLAKEVTLVHRSDKFRAHDDSVRKFLDAAQKSPHTVRVRLNTECTGFVGQTADAATKTGTKLEAVTLRNLDDNAETTLHVDDALVMFGFNSSLGKLREWGIELVKDCIAVNDCMETSLPGVYAAGDIVEYRGKLKLIATGFSEAAIAVNFAKTYMNPKEKAQPLHSTTIMELKEKREARKK